MHTVFKNLFFLLSIFVATNVLAESLVIKPLDQMTTLNPTCRYSIDMGNGQTFQMTKLGIVGNIRQAESNTLNINDFLQFARGKSLSVNPFASDKKFSETYLNTQSSAWGRSSSTNDQVVLVLRQTSTAAKLVNELGMYIFSARNHWKMAEFIFIKTGKNVLEFCPTVTP